MTNWEDIGNGIGNIYKGIFGGGTPAALQPSSSQPSPDNGTGKSANSNTTTYLVLGGIGVAIVIFVLYIAFRKK